jgi:hypothetical protein
MSTSPTEHTWMTRLAHRVPSSSDARVLDAHFASCVLDLLGQARPQAHSARKADI